VSGAIVVMGVSGCGKTTLGHALAAALHRPFVEGDALHPPENVAKMRSGIPLTDADRQPWLERVARTIADRRDEGVVVACSALKRVYRDTIRRMAGEVWFVLPQLDRETLQARLAGRKDHFMPASLLDSQLETLEAPGGDERAVVVDGALSTPEQLGIILGVINE
jgi:carbohydrate kinase (thermoresistant glucokinase family)